MPVIPPLVATILEYLGIAATTGAVVDAAMSAFESSKGDAHAVADAAAKASKMRVTAAEKRAAARSGLEAARSAAAQAAQNKKILPKLAKYGGIGLTALFAAPIVKDLFFGGGEEAQLQDLMSAQDGVSSPQDLVSLLGGLQEEAGQREMGQREELGRLRGEVAAADTMNRMGSRFNPMGTSPYLEELIRGNEEAISKMAIRQQNPSLAETLAMQGLFAPQENNISQYMS